MSDLDGLTWLMPSFSPFPVGYIMYSFLYTCKPATPRNELIYDDMTDE